MSSSRTPITQLASRGLRNAPVKNVRNMWATSAAMNSCEAQWWTCRTNSPPRTSNERRSVLSYAWDMATPRKPSKAPSYATVSIDGSKNSAKYMPDSSSTMKL